jgi:16S rRNA (cytosine967-C5)-methyltransferase
MAIEQGARANLITAEMLGGVELESRDRNLVTELVYGTCRMQRACDWLISRHAKGRLDVEVRSALRMGTYQIGWTRIPPHAAVSATVEEVHGPGRTMVNAVLRRVADDVSKGLVAWPDRATEMSYPDWIVDTLTNDLGRVRTFAALAQMNEPASATHRDDGYIQDLASQLVASHLDGLLAARRAADDGRQPLVLDLCAAPGGKATALAAGSSHPFVVASDVSVERCRYTASNINRLGQTEAVTVVADGTEAPFRPASFDLVLVDAPCSGLGVLRRRPDARWRIQPGDVDRLAGLQRRLLVSALSLVRPGGIVAYSVCTLSAAETASVDNWLAQIAPGWRPLRPPGSPWNHAGRGALLLPQDAGTDGMYLLSLTN